MSISSRARQAAREARQGEKNQQKLNAGDPAATPNPSASDRVNGGQPCQGITCKRYITKQDILDLLQYERDTGYRFNRMPNDEFIARLQGDEQMPVIWAFVHNGVEMRVVLKAPDKTQVYLDMPFDRLFQVDRAVLPSFPHFDAPRKGINVVRYVTKADIGFLKGYQTSDGRPCLCKDAITFLQKTQNSRLSLGCETFASCGVVQAVCFGNTNDRSNGMYVVYIPIERYFALRKEEVPCTAEDNKKDAA